MRKKGFRRGGREEDEVDAHSLTDSITCTGGASLGLTSGSLGQGRGPCHLAQRCHRLAAIHILCTCELELVRLTMQNAVNSNATTPLKRLALHSTVTCSAQASEYGKCILATYTDIRKDACKEEFAKFGACLRQAVSTWCSRRDRILNLLR